MTGAASAYFEVPDEPLDDEPVEPPDDDPPDDPDDDPEDDDPDDPDDAEALDALESAFAVEALSDFESPPFFGVDE